MLMVSPSKRFSQLTEVETHYVERVCLVQVASAMPLGGMRGVCAPQLPFLTGEE